MIAVVAFGGGCQADLTDCNSADFQKAFASVAQRIGYGCSSFWIGSVERFGDQDLMVELSVDLPTPVHAGLQFAARLTEGETSGGYLDVTVGRDLGFCTSDVGEYVVQKHWRSTAGVVLVDVRKVQFRPGGPPVYTLVAALEDVVITDGYASCSMPAFSTMLTSVTTGDVD
ncbi:MAG: hypothetical protein H6732_19400 [Alphaproteobacteria bacterium]|nr:hypothetical protein [Alphaproteobacteria bacterium]